MVTDPAALERYLARRPYVLPSFKGQPSKSIEQAIKTRTGKAPVFLTEPRAHQLEGLAFALHLERCLLYYGMRLGKTKITLDWAMHLRRTGAWKGAGLIIAHAPVGLDVWVAEAAKHSNLTIKAVHLDVSELIDTIANPPDLVVMTWSGMQQMFTVSKQVKRGKRKGETKLYPDLGIVRLVAEAFTLVAIDEIHTASNWESLQYKIGLELVSNCRFRLGLTGTPFGRDPYKVWAQFRLIEGGDIFTKNFLFFVEAFSKRKLNPFSRRRDTKGKGYELVMDDTKLPILSAKIAAAAMSYSRAEVVTDDVQAGVVDLHMGGRQLEAYRDAVDRIIKLPGHDPRELVSTFHRLRQISSGYLPYVDDEGEERLVAFPHSAKFEWLEAFLDEAPPGMPMLFFHDYIHTGRLICEALKARKLGHVWMRGDGQDKTKLVKAFQVGNAQIMVANAKSGGISVDLNRTDYMCYFESPVSPITRAQSEARPLAERSGRLLTLDDLVCSPMDKRVLEFIKEGKDLMHEVVTKNDLKQLRI